VGILLFLVLVLLEVLSAAWRRFQDGGQPEITAMTFIVMGATFMVNLVVVFYERRAGARLQSEILFADAHHTLSDLLTSATVIVALIGVGYGYTWLDPAAAVIVAVFIGYACWEIFESTSGILADRIVIPEEDIRAVVTGVPDVIGCHQIRTRGSADFVFLDLHVWMDAAMPLERAHALSHIVKDQLMARFPQIKDAVIHIEPPPAGL
jgi:cation diffusion facilitator family transporter